MAESDTNDTTPLDPNTGGDKQDDGTTGSGTGTGSGSGDKSE